MGAADLPAIARVHRDSCLVAYAFMGWDYPLAEIEAHYREKLPTWDFARVVEWEGRVEGYLGCRGDHLDHLFLAPVIQRRGLGRTLAAAHLDRGLRPVTLTVFEENRPARRLYESFGFRTVERFWNDEDGAWELACRLD